MSGNQTRHGDRSRAEILRRKSEASVRAMVDASPLIMWVSDETGRISYVNEAWRQFCGRSLTDLVAVGAADLLHPDDVAHIHRQIEIARSTHGSYSGEGRIRAADGSWRWVLSTGLPQFNHEGEMTGYVGSWVDVTERKEAEMALHRLAEELETRVEERTAALAASQIEVTRQTRLLESMVESMGEGVIAIGTDGTLLLVNAAASRMIVSDESVSAEEMEKYGFFVPDSSERFPTEDLPMMRALLGESVDNVMLVSRQKSTPPEGILLRITGRPLRSVEGDVIGAIVVCRDVTDLERARKLAEASIQALNDELEERVRDRTAALEAANRDLTNYASSIAHDLRTPLRSIAGFAHVLEEDYAEGLGPEGARVLGIVRRSAQDMGGLIDTLLKFSAGGGQTLDRLEIDMEALARKCVDALADEYAGRDVTVVIGSLPPCHGDAKLLERLWLHLIANAIKFTRRRDHARIEIGSMAAENGDGAGYFIRDNGVGFDMSNNRRLFGVFQRLNKSGEFEGAGVGLADVARIVGLHGGRVWAEAEPDRGATFYFTVSEGAPK